MLVLAGLLLVLACAVLVAAFPAQGEGEACCSRRRAHAALAPRGAEEAAEKGRAPIPAALTWRAARRSQELAALEEEWGDWLCEQRQTDAATAHFERAGAYAKAIEAAIDSKQWERAVGIVDRQAPPLALLCYILRCAALRFSQVESPALWAHHCEARGR